MSTHIAQQIRSTLNLISEETYTASAEIQQESLQGLVNQSKAIIRLALHQLKAVANAKSKAKPIKVKQVKPPSQTTAKPIKPVKPVKPIQPVKPVKPIKRVNPAKPVKPKPLKPLPTIET